MSRNECAAIKNRLKSNANINLSLVFGLSKHSSIRLFASTVFTVSSVPVYRAILCDYDTTTARHSGCSV